MKNNKTERVELRMTQQEKNTFDSIARLAGLSVSALIIRSVLGDLAGDSIIKIREQLDNSTVDLK